jgi:uncharacterized protein YfaS (alpha-2-macroglobulin family)
MFGTRWIKPTRRNQVKSTSGQKLRIKIIKIVDHNNVVYSLVRSVKKVQKLRTDILKCQTAIIGAGSANLQFESGFLIGIKRF